LRIGANRVGIVMTQRMAIDHHEGTRRNKKKKKKASAKNEPSDNDLEALSSYRFRKGPQSLLGYSSWRIMNRIKGC
jgi:hypothetical protein